MKKEILIFFAALVILGVTFAAYLDWLLIQPRPVVAQVKAPPPPALADSDSFMLDRHAGFVAHHF